MENKMKEKNEKLKNLIDEVLEFARKLSDDPIDKGILDDFEDELNKLNTL